jgi:hypothetical protein
MDHHGVVYRWVVPLNDLLDGNTGNSRKGNPSIKCETVVYFLGFIADAPFTSTMLRYNAGVEGAFLYTIDDLITAAGPMNPVPEPSTLVLVATGLLSAGCWQRRRAARA